MTPRHNLSYQKGPTKWVYLIWNLCASTETEQWSDVYWLPKALRHDRGGKEHGAHTFSTTTCCYTVVAQVISQSLRLIAANSSEPRQPLTASLIPPRLIPTFLQPSFLTTPTSTRSPIRAHPHLLNPLLDHFNLHPNWPWDSLALLKGRLFVVLCG